MFEFAEGSLKKETKEKQGWKWNPVKHRSYLSTGLSFVLDAVTTLQKDIFEHNQLFCSVVTIYSVL